MQQFSSYGINYAPILFMGPRSLSASSWEAGDGPAQYEEEGQPTNRRTNVPKPYKNDDMGTKTNPNSTQTKPQTQHKKKPILEQNEPQTYFPSDQKNLAGLVSVVVSVWVVMVALALVVVLVEALVLAVVAVLVWGLVFVLVLVRREDGEPEEAKEEEGCRMLRDGRRRSREEEEEEE